MRPGPNVSVTTATPPVTPPTNTGTWFAFGPAEQGPTVPILLTSFAQFQKKLGGRYSKATDVSDAVEKYFEEGGSRLYFCRATFKEDVVAKIEIKNEAKAAFALTVEAGYLGTPSKGVWGNEIEAVVKATATTVQLEVKFKAETVETSPVFTGAAGACVTQLVEWAKVHSEYVVLTQTKVEALAEESKKLASGVDKGVIELVEYEAALNQFKQEHGPGQLSCLGIAAGSGTATDIKLAEATVKAATKENRRAVVDIKKGATKAEMKTFVEAIKALASPNPRNVYVMGSWLEVTSTATGLTIPRSVPGSPFVAAKCAVVDSLGNPNRAAAGNKGILTSAIGFTTVNFTETEIEELSILGVNLCKAVAGQIRIYGSRTAANIEKDPLYTQFNNSRLDMAVLWKGLAIEEEFMFSQIDGEGKDTSAYGNALKGMMLGLYKVGAVFGNEPSAAFAVDISSTVNTLLSESEGILNATIAMRRSPGAEQVNLNIVRVGVTAEV